MKQRVSPARKDCREGTQLSVFRKENRASEGRAQSLAYACQKIVTRELLIGDFQSNHSKYD
jgi:hypothetical protein